MRERAFDAQRRVLDLVLREGHVMSSVDSPPGAGKTRLVEAVVATAVQRFGMSVAVATPRAEQSFDLLRRLSKNFEPMQIEVLQSNRRFLPADLRADPRVAAPVSNPDDLLGGAGVVVGTASKFISSVSRFRHPQFQLLICDEAYQLPARDVDPLVTIAGQVLLLGDPGQLPPLVRVDPGRFEAARYRVHRPAPEELSRRFPEIPREQLPATFRFPQDTVDFVQPSFYPDLPFGTGVPAEERRLGLRAAGVGTPVDRALDLLAEGASVVGILAPEKPVGQGEVDDEIAAIMAQVCRRALDRGAQWEGERRIGPADIGCADAHVASGAAARRHLQTEGMPEEIVVETPEIWQGRQRPLMVVKHTLSGLLRVDPFALEPGRTCVMLSRHQVGCVIVGRDGVGEALDRYQHDSGARPSGAEDLTWSGWQAQATLWERLERSGRLIRIG